MKLWTQSSAQARPAGRMTVAELGFLIHKKIIASHVEYMCIAGESTRKRL